MRKHCQSVPFVSIALKLKKKWWWTYEIDDFTEIILGARIASSFGVQRVDDAQSSKTSIVNREVETNVSKSADCSIRDPRVLPCQFHFRERAVCGPCAGEFKVAGSEFASKLRHGTGLNEAKRGDAKCCNTDRAHPEFGCTQCGNTKRGNTEFGCTEFANTKWVESSFGTAKHLDTATSPTDGGYVGRTNAGTNR